MKLEEYSGPAIDISFDPAVPDRDAAGDGRERSTCSSTWSTVRSRRCSGAERTTCTWWCRWYSAKREHGTPRPRAAVRGPEPVCSPAAAGDGSRSGCAWNRPGLTQSARSTPESRAWPGSGGNVLEIEVKGAVPMQELSQFHKRRVLERLRKDLTGVTIADLRFRAGAW